MAAISSNPQVVSSASLSAATSGYNRLQQLATMQSPVDASLVFALLFNALMFAIAWAMWRNKWFVKV